MSEQPETVEQKAVREATARLNCSMEEANALQVVERTLIAVERLAPANIARQYTTKATVDAARSFSQAVRDGDLARISECEARFADELYLWRTAIMERDEQIMTYNLRRFCERPDISLDVQVFAALTRFYRSCPHSGPVQSKYDFVVTRLFTALTDGKRRALRIDRERLVERLSETYAAWGRSQAGEAYDRAAIMDAVNAFDYISIEATAIEDFDDLLVRDIFNRTRAFKSSLGTVFYAPEVTAAAIECNTVLSNKFSELLEEEGAQIRHAPEACRELVDIFNDVSPGAPAQLTRVLEELQAADRDEDAAAQERLERLMRLLRVACDLSSGAADAPSDSGARSGGEVPAVGGEGAPTLSVDLSALAEHPDNKDIIADYLDPSRPPEIHALDLAVFLSLSPEGASESEENEASARRRSLALILRADEMVRLGLAGEGALGSNIEAELAELMEEMQQSGSRVRGLMSEAAAVGDNATAERLLYVSNHLLESRLRVQSAIVRRSAGELARSQQARAAAARSASNVVPIEKGRAPKVKRRMIKLIAAAAVLILTIFLGLPLAMRGDDTKVERDKNVRLLDRTQLPGGDLLSDARLRRDVLIAIVSEAWKKQPDEKKRESLAALLRYGSDNGARTVMLLDKQGMPVGNASGQQVDLAREIQEAQ